MRLCDRPADARCLSLYPAARASFVKQVHLVVGVLATALTGASALYGAWCWRRIRSSVWFWRLLRASQAVVVLEVVLGGVVYLVDKKSSGLHVLYGVLPLLVAFAGLHREIGLRTVAAVAATVVVATGSRHFVELPFLARRAKARVEPGQTVAGVAAA